MIEMVALSVILVVLLACAIVVAMAKDLLYATVALAAFSVLLALAFYLLRAPDVAIAEAAIGAAVTTALFIIAIKSTKRME